MTVEQARELLGFSMCDFSDRVHVISTPVLQALRAQLVSEQSTRLTTTGIAAIDAELEARP